MRHGRIPERDPFLVAQLKQLEVPEAHPDFWDTLVARLEDEVQSVTPRRSDRSRKNVVPMSIMLDPSLDPEADESTNHHVDDRRDHDGAVTAIDINSRRRLGSGRFGWLAAAAATVALIGGGLGLARITDDQSTTLIDAAADGSAESSVEGDTVPVPGTVDARNPPRYDLQPEASLLGHGAIAGQTMLDDSALVFREVPESDGRGCQAGDPQVTIDALSVSGASTATGVGGLVGPAVHIDRSGRVVVTSVCDGVTIGGVGTLGSDGSITLAPPSDPSEPMMLIGSPIWASDGSGFVMTGATDTGFELVGFDADGLLIGAEDSSGLQLARLADGRAVAVEGDALVIAGEVIIPGGIDAASRAVVDATGTEVTVYGGHGAILVGADNPSGTTIHVGPVLDAAFSPLGDVALLTGGEQRGLTVVDVETGLGQAFAVDTGLAGFVPDGLTWTEGGRTLMVSGSTDEVSDSVWALRFAVGTGAPTPTDDGQHDAATEPESEETIIGDVVDPSVIGDGAPHLDSEGIINYAYEDIDRGEIMFVGSDLTPRPVIAMYPSEDVDNQLVGTIELGGVVHVVYQHTEFEPGNSPAGVTSLVVDDLDPSTADRILETRTMSGIDGSWMYTESVQQVGDRLWLERSFHQGACYWVDAVDSSGSPIADPENGWPRPEVDLDALSAEYANGAPGELAAACPSTTPIFG